jgi:hypothetical protein
VKIYFIVPKPSSSFQEKKTQNPKKNGFFAVLSRFCCQLSEIGETAISQKKKPLFGRFQGAKKWRISGSSGGSAPHYVA